MQRDYDDNMGVLWTSAGLFDRTSRNCRRVWDLTYVGFDNPCPTVHDLNMRLPALRGCK